MAIRLLALDLDGTLLNPRGQLTERSRQAIFAARDCGVHVALCTGRRFRDARPIALELGLDLPLISHNGALTKHVQTLETVAVLLLPLAAAQNAVRVGREFGADALVSDDHTGLGILVYDHLSGDNPSLRRYIAWARRVHGEEGSKAIREVPSLATWLDHEPVHIAFTGGCAMITELASLLQTELGETVKLLSTMYPAMDFALLDILHPQASKGAGVAAAAAELGIAAHEVMAVGDNFNDLEMLEFAGTAVVMANADATLRERSDFHKTASNAEDGVALAIEKFILEVHQQTVS
jgi:hydroxymethylpyrimidine pyrophosphatase-like HAD family hydrolase